MTQNFATFYNEERKSELKAQRKAHRKELYKMWTLAISIVLFFCVAIILLACI